MFTATLFIRALKWKQSYMSDNKWSDKQIVVYFYNRLPHSAIKMNKLLTDTYNNMDESQKHYVDSKQPVTKE